jgi:hypothetical protein
MLADHHPHSRRIADRFGFLQAASGVYFSAVQHRFPASETDSSASRLGQGPSGVDQHTASFNELRSCRFVIGHEIDEAFHVRVHSRYYLGFGPEWDGAQ